MNEYTWEEIFRSWLWAHISDEEFISRATEIGKESNAIALINEDLITP